MMSVIIVTLYSVTVFFLRINCETQREDLTVHVCDKQAAWKVLSEISRTAPARHPDPFLACIGKDLVNTRIQSCSAYPQNLGSIKCPLIAGW